MEFNQKIKPKLTANTVIEKFSTSSLEQKYLVIMGEKRFEISSSIHSLLKLIDGENSFEEIAEKYSVVMEKTISLLDIQYIFKNILKPKGLLHSSQDIVFETKKNHIYIFVCLLYLSSN